MADATLASLPASRLRRAMPAHAIGLLALTGILALWSSRFADPAGAGAGAGALDLTGFVAAYVAAAVVYLAAVVRLMRWSVVSWLILVAVGAAMRLAMLTSIPVLETDFYRYLWDGAVSARGINPYAHAPREVITALQGRSDLPPALVSEARGAEGILRRVSYPELTTIYPPVAQASFAAAHILSPGSMVAWRVVLLAIDATTFVLLIALLREIGRPVAWSAVYWWNPLVVKEIFNSGHMDAVAFPFVLGALLAALRGRVAISGTALAVAGAAKVWPVILLPILLRQASGTRRRAIAGAAAFACASVILWSPLWLVGMDHASGFAAYSRSWQSNDALFGAIVALLNGTLGVLSVQFVSAQALTRGLLVLALAGWVAHLAAKAPDATRLPARCLAAVAALFLVSPTQFPWYYTWLMPLLALEPVMPLLLYTALLPLYYLTYLFWGRIDLPLLASAIAWAQHAPVWAALAWHYRRPGDARSSRTRTGETRWTGA